MLIEKNIEHFNDEVNYLPQVQHESAHQHKKNEPEYEMYKDYVLFRKYMELNEKLESDGVITVNSPWVVEEEEDKKGNIVIMVVIGIVIAGLLL